MGQIVIHVFHITDYPTTSEVRKSYPLQQTTVSPVATWSSLVRSDGPIDYFSSTVKKGGLDIDQVHFGLDLSNIEGTIDVQSKENHKICIIL